MPVFVDHLVIHARAGKGGAGSAHFQRFKFNPKGGPDGGDGGDGGHVIFQVDPSTDSLRTFFYKSRIAAEDGRPGSERNRTGRRGKTSTFNVPPGTVIHRLEGPSTLAEAAQMVKDDQPDLERKLVGDLTKLGEKFTLCQGGKGGRGNQHFVSSTNQAPTEAEPGTAGEEGFYHIELRSIADAGLVGFPNAGKSTLLGALSAAQPKIGAYPFTTLQPKVGVIDFDGWSRCTVADIPGILENAHKGKGLGLDFLRHIMRCRTLLFVVDTAGSEGRHPVSDLEILRTEISSYSDELAQRPWVIIANKMDLEDAQTGIDELRQRFPKKEIFPISAQGGEGLEALREWLRGRLGHEPEYSRKSREAQAQINPKLSSTDLT